MAKAKKKLENFDNVLVLATITATSNKSDGKYKQKKPSKTVYIVPERPEDEKVLIDFGLTQYTPGDKKDKNAKPYFIVKATEWVKFYTGEEKYDEVFFGVQHEDVNRDTGEITTRKALNYLTTKPVYLSIMFVEGGDNGNDFYRMNAIMHKDRDVLEEVQPVNPFASLFESEDPFA